MLHTAIFFLVKLLSFFFTLSCLYLVCTVCWANFFTHTHNVGSCIDNKCFEITHRYIGQCRNNGKWTNVHREMCIRIRNYRWFTVTAIRWARSRSVCSACFALYHFWFVVGIAVAVTFFFAALALDIWNGKNALRVRSLTLLTSTHTQTRSTKISRG